MFGAIYAGVLTGHLAGQSLPRSLTTSTISPDQLRALPAATRAGYVSAYAD